MPSVELFITIILKWKCQFYVKVNRNLYFCVEKASLFHANWLRYVLVVMIAESELHACFLPRFTFFL